MTENDDTNRDLNDEQGAQKVPDGVPTPPNGDDAPETLTGERSTSVETGGDTILPTPEPSDGGAPAP